MILQRYSIATRIGFVVGVVLLMMLVLAYVEMRGLGSIRRSLDEIVGKHHQRLQTVQEMRFLARHCAVVVRNVLLVSGQEAKSHERSRFEEGAAAYGLLLEQLRKQPEHSEEEKRIIERVADCSDITFTLWRNAIADENGPEPEEAMRLLQDEIRSHQWGLIGGLDNLVREEKRLAETAMQQALANHARIKSILILINVLTIGAGLFFMAAITASIVGPLGEISRKVDRIAGGDFQSRIDLDQQDEIGQLAAHINRMVDKLNANEEELKEYRYHLEELIELRTGEINDQRERFVSVLIHDLKGPLVPIIGFSRLLQTGENLTREKITRYAGEIHASTTKLSNVIDQTTRSLKEKRTAFSFDREPFDLGELLYSVAKSCLPALKADRVSLKLNGKEVEDYGKNGEKLMFSGDIGKLRSLMENLLGNAGKYALSRIEVQMHRSGDQLQLVVEDDGGGVAEPFRKKIFEEYYQAPGSKEGTGVGLYSVRRTVEHYQGSVAVHASPLGGARFVVTLPLG